MKQVNETGFSGLWPVLVIAVIVLIGGVGYYVMRQQSNDSSISNTTQTDGTANKEKQNKNEVKYPADWVEYGIVYESERDVVFWAPRAWVDIQQAGSDLGGDYFYAHAATEPGFFMGAPEPDHSNEGRGAVLTDFTDFEIKGNDIYLVGFTGATKAAEGYRALGTDLPGIVNYSVNHMGETFRHAILKTNGRTKVINVVCRVDLLTEEQFKSLLESIELKRTF